MTSTRRLARGVATNWLYLVLNVAVSFFLAPFVVRELGSVYYGIWAVTVQFTGYLYLLDFGVRESVVRYTSKYVARRQRHKLNAVLNIALRVYAPIMLGTLVLGGVASYFAPDWFDVPPESHDDAMWAIVFVTCTVAQTFFFNVFTGVQIGLQRLDIANFIGIGLTVVRTILIVVSLRAGGGIVALGAIQFAVAFVAGLAGMIVSLRLLEKEQMPFSIVRLTGRRRKALAQRVFGYGWYVLVNNVGQKIIFATDTVVVASFLPISAVTYYAVAGTLADQLRSILQSTSHAFAPVASHFHSLGQRDEVARILVRGAKLTVLIAMPIGLTFMLLGHTFIGLWMGPEFVEESGRVLFVLAVMQIFSAPHHVVSSVLYGMSRHKVIALLRLAEGALNLTLTITLVQRLGLIGVAVGIAVSHILMVVVVLPWRACTVIGLSVPTYLVGTYLRPALAAIPMAIGAYLVNLWFAIPNLLVFFGWVALLLCVYLPSAYFLALDADERGFVKGLVSGRRNAPKA